MLDYLEINTAFNDKLVIFKIIPVKKEKTLLGFTSFGDVWHIYKVKGNIDHAKKIISNTVKHFIGSSVDCYDIDLCLRKTFALKLIKIKGENYGY